MHRRVFLVSNRSNLILQLWLHYTQHQGSQSHSWLLAGLTGRLASKIVAKQRNWQLFYDCDQAWTMWAKINWGVSQTVLLEIVLFGI